MSLVTNAAATSAATNASPPAAEIVDGYRTAPGGGLDAEKLAQAIYAESGGDMEKAQAFKTALPDALGPLERAAVDRALSRQDGISLGEHAVDGAAQFGKGVWGMAKGLGSLAWSTVKTGYDTNLSGLAVDAIEAKTGHDLPDWLPSAERGAARLGAGKDAVVALGKVVWDDPSVLLNEYKPLLADGRYGAIVGQAAADFGDLLIGAKGAGKAGQVAKAADTASDLARTVRIAGGADEAAGALKATRAVLDGIDVSKLPDDVARKVEVAKAELNETARFSRGGSVPPVPRPQALADVRADAIAKGVEIRSGPEADAYLDYAARMHGQDPSDFHAVALGEDLVFVRESHLNNPRTLREELIHTDQAKRGEQSSATVVQNEIAAREEMIENADKWGITAEEVAGMKRDIQTMNETGRY